MQRPRSGASCMTSAESCSRSALQGLKIAIRYHVGVTSDQTKLCSPSLAMIRPSCSICMLSTNTFLRILQLWILGSRHFLLSAFGGGRRQSVYKSVHVEIAQLSTTIQQFGFNSVFCRGEETHPVTGTDFACENRSALESVRSLLRND